MRLLQPEQGIWLLVIPAIVIFWLAYFLYKRHGRRREEVQPRFQRLSRRSHLGRDTLVLVLASAAAGLLVAALMRPQVVTERYVVEFERQDLVVVLDRSVSMRARDVNPSRAERALTELKNFLQRKPETIDRVGLVGFANAPLILSYLTRDVDALLFYLDWMAEDPTIFYGTDIGAALTSGLEVVARDTQSTRKIFLVISDGEDQGTTLDAAVATARKQKIQIHAIGVGSAGEVPLPVSQSGQREVFLRDDEGRLVTTQFDETSLRAIAAATGGRYMRSQSGSELVSALNAIERGGRRQVGSSMTNEYRDVYRWLLAGALAAVAVMVAIA